MRSFKGWARGVDIAGGCPEPLDLGALSFLLVVFQDVLVSNFKWIVVSNFKLSRCHNCRCIRIDGVLWCVMSQFLIVVDLCTCPVVGVATSQFLSVGGGVCI